MKYRLAFRLFSLGGLVTVGSASAPQPPAIRGIGCITGLSAPWSFESGGRRMSLTVGSVVPGPGTLHPPANSVGHEFVVVLFRSGHHQRLTCSTTEECSRNYPISMPSAPPHGVSRFLDWFIERFRHDDGHLKSMIGALPPTTTPAVVVPYDEGTLDLREILNAHPGEQLRVALVPIRMIFNAPQFASTSRIETSSTADSPASTPAAGIGVARSREAETTFENMGVLTTGQFSAMADRDPLLRVNRLIPGLYGLIVTSDSGHREFVWIWTDPHGETGAAAQEFGEIRRLIETWDAETKSEFAAIFIRAYLVYLATR